MNKSSSTMAEQVAQAAIAIGERRTRHAAKSVNVMLSDNTLVITPHGALSPAETALDKTAAGSAKVSKNSTACCSTARALRWVICRQLSRTSREVTTMRRLLTLVVLLAVVLGGVGLAARLVDR